ncbi:MAG: beta-lactamase family protein [Actinobacteria bacterium]|nr:beta-lactamase family protein [Actinomycetota bacterium]
MSLTDALPALDDLVARTAAEHHCPTIAWGVVADGRLAHTAGWGHLDDGRSPTADTVYRIASMTKSFTAAAVLMLRDDGALWLDDPIVQHAPELAPALPEGVGPIRLRHLLSMSSGLATDDAWADRHLDISDDELDRALAGGVLLAGTPGATYEYSNLGYGLIGRVVKRCTGRRVQDIISERVLSPLGMNHTTWVQPDHDDWARPYEHRDGTAVPDGPPLGDGEIAPMGGLWTNLTDLATWMTWLDDANRAGSARPGSTDDVLSRSSRRELQQMHRYIGMVPSADRTVAAGYGFGLRVRDDPRIGLVVTHSGGVPGYGSSMRWLSGRGFGVAAMANITYAPMTELLQSMLDVLADHEALPPVEPVDPTIVEQVGRRLVDLLNDWDDRTADELFTDNVALDDSYARRRASAERWLEACGRFVVERVDVTRPTTGRLALTHPSGEPLWLDLDLAPTRPLRVQWYELSLG